MKQRWRWDRCIYHRGIHTDSFFSKYFSDEARKVLFIAGAGFDPRSTKIASVLPEKIRSEAKAVLIREERPNPDSRLLALANENSTRLRQLFPQSAEHVLQIFSQDNAVIGGRAGARLAQEASLAEITDIFVDVSALSIGIAFPIIKHFVELLGTHGQPQCNLHVVCTDNPGMDMAIKSVPSDSPAPIHGFRGGWGLNENANAAFLWMPQLSHGKQAVLSLIFQMLQNAQPDTVVCPILPFPSTRARFADELIEAYADQIQSRWSVDARDLVYADEKNPLDLYRTILRIDEARRRIFDSVGGSQIILSPLGNKALSVGALMAALEKNFTIVYVESISYTLNEEKSNLAGQSGDFVHIWLHGDIYGSCGTGEAAGGTSP